MKTKFLTALFAAACLISVPSTLRAQSSPFGSSPFQSSPFQSTPFGTNEEQSQNNSSISSSSSSASYSYTRCRICYKWHKPHCSTPTKNVPFDGGLTILVGASVAYGFKRAYDKRKKTAAGDASEK